MSREVNRPSHARQRWYQRAIAPLRGVVFLLRNWCVARELPIVPTAELGHLEFCPCAPDLAVPVERLYEVLNDGQPLSRDKRLLLRLLGQKLCVVVRNKKDGAIVGMSLYYFNARDRVDRTVHEGYTGIVAQYRGQGLGTSLRKHAIRHFARCPHLRGVSSRVSVDNLPSLNINLRLGFEIVERYHDPVLGVERVYLVCDLDPYRQ